MAGGSPEPDGDEDRQCIECGLWYDSQGLHKHEANCDLAAFDRRLVDLVDPFAIARADDVEPENAQAMRPDRGDDPVDDVQGPEDSFRVPDVEQSAPQTRNVSSGSSTKDAARTDGGPQAVPSDWGDAGADVDDEDEEPCCPACGSTRHFDPSDLPDAVLEDAPELGEYDRACGPCSKTDDGHLADTVEVYNV